MAGDADPALDGTLIYRKSRRGTAELAASHGVLSAPSRRVLILLDGRRTLSELAELFGADEVARVVDDLEVQGFARRVDPNDMGLTTQQVPLRDGQEPSMTTLLDSVTPPDLERPRRRGLWIALLLFVTAGAIAGGYRFALRPDRAAPSDPPVASPGAREASAPADLATPGSSPTQAEHEVRELPLSGLPAAPERPPAAAAPARRGAEVPAAPAPAEQPVVAAVPPAAPPVAAPPAAASALPQAAPSAASAPVSAVRVVDVSGAKSEPAPAAAPVAAAGAPPVQVATAAPTVVPAPEPVALKPRRHDPPKFPLRALRAGITEGHVLAHVWVTPEGGVEQVDIVRATPPRYFDDEVKRALSVWTFEPPGRAVDTTVELTFKP